MEIDEKHLQALLANLSQKKRCADFVRLLNTIPGFSLTLTAEENDVIGSPGNNIVIGRSGTGKTTCAMLRLLAMQITFKYWMVQFERPLAPEDLDSASPLHTVFVTAAPVLCTEVQNYYNSLKEHIKKQLILKQESKGDIEDLDEQPEFNEGEEDLPQSDEEAEEELAQSLPMSLHGLRDSDFPMFITARRLIFMIDAAVGVPFFARDEKGNIIGQSSKYEWHNEGGGQMLINKGFKKAREETDLKIQDAELSSEESEEEEEEIAKPTNKSRLGRKQQERKGKKFIRALRITSFEVTPHIFETRFWPIVQYSTSLPAFVVWSEIHSHIKGHSTAYTYSGYYLPRNVYVSLYLRAELHSEDELNKIYEIFLKYERWKVRTNAFDLQDVVNYLNYMISTYKLRAPPIHYMMIDEVQDLTHATIRLFMLVTKQNLFFSGDTAQTIAKGAGFKFADLYKTMQFTVHTSPTLLHLHRNFRSHQQILNLANSVVNVIELLFPSTIDILSKEFSTERGEKPTVILNGSVEDLVQEVFGKSLSTSEVPFGCNLAVLVRNQESKQTVNELLGHVLCLTIYEAKGLEFDDVILFNFFQDCEMDHRHWNMLNYIKTVREFLDAGNTKVKFDSNTDINTKLAFAHGKSTYHNPVMCNELKQLYVGITRPKHRLFIFDQDPNNRTQIQNFWKKFELVRFSANVLTNIGGWSQFSTSAWRIQGIRMLKHKFYMNAARCFEMAHEYELANRCKAHYLADKAAEVLVRAQQELDECPKKNHKLKKQRRVAVLRAQHESSSKFIEAAQLFLEYGANEQPKIKKQAIRNAARCYASANEFTKAGELFEQIEMWPQAGEAYYSGKQYYKAAEIFGLVGDYYRQIDCYSMVEDWEKNIRVIFENKGRIQKVEKVVYKYLPLALEDLTEKVLRINREPQDFEQVTKKTGVAVIQEEDEKDSDEDPEEATLEQVVTPQKFDENIVDKKVFYKNIVDKQKSEDEKNEESSSNESFEVVDSKSEGSSFMVLNSSADFSLIDNDSLHDINPDDPFLHSDSGSVIESVASSILPDGTLPSEYSIIDLNPAVPSHQLIRTRHDIYAEDELMHTVIEFLSMFSDQIKVFLNDLRSKDSLVSSQLSQAEWDPSGMTELDEIDQELLGLLLDVLEEFQMYKLCLIVCNRYGLAERLGRYLVSIASNFSNLGELKPIDFRHNFFVPNQSQRTGIAYGALHNALEMVEPKFLSRESSKFLGTSAFQGLLLLGYWKKLLFIVDLHNALALAYTFSDHFIYHQIYKETGKEFNWEQFEESPQEYQAALVSLEQFLLENNKNTELTISSKAPSHIQELPAIFELNFQLWTHWKAKSFSEIIKLTQSTLSIFRKYHSRHTHSYFEKLRFIDAVSTLSQILIMVNHSADLQDLFESLPWNKYETLIQSVGILFNTLKESSHLLTPDLTGIYIAFGAKLVWPSSINEVLPWETHVVLQRDSLLSNTINLQTPDLFIPDLEGGFLLAPIQEVNKLIGETFSLVLRRIQSRRNAEVSSTDLHANANLLGETWQLQEYRRRLKGSSKFTDSHYVLEEMFNQQDELSECYRQLKMALARFGDETLTEEERSFMKNPEIIRLEKEIKRLTKNRDPSRQQEELFTLALTVFKQSCKGVSAEVELTATAKLALLHVTQRVFVEWEQSTAQDNHYPLWIAFEFAKIGGFLTPYQEMLNSQLKPTLDKFKSMKIFRVSDEYRCTQGWLNMQVYSELHDYANIALTALDMIAVMKSTANISLLNYLLSKAVVAWALAQQFAITLPLKLVEQLSVEKTGPCEYIAKVTSKCYPELCVELMKELSEVLLMAVFSNWSNSEKGKFIEKKFDLALIIFACAPAEQIADPLKLIFCNYLHSKHSLHVKLPDQLNEFISTLSIEGLQDYQKEMRTSYFDCKISKVESEGTLSALLDSQWYQETKLLACNKQAAISVRKFRFQAVLNSRKLQWQNTVYEAHPLSWLNATSLVDCAAKAEVKTLLAEFIKVKLEICRCAYQLGIRKPLDFHYILQNIILCSVRVRNVTVVSNNVTNLTEATQQVVNMLKDITKWKKDAIPRSQKFVSKARKMWYVKWGLKYKGLRTAHKKKVRKIK